MKKFAFRSGAPGKALKAALLSATLISSGAAAAELAPVSPPPVIAHVHMDEDGAGKAVIAPSAEKARGGLFAGLIAAAAAAGAALFRILAPRQFRAAAAKVGETAAKTAKQAVAASKAAAGAVGRIAAKPLRWALMGAGGLGAGIIAFNSFDGSGWAGDAAAGFALGALAMASVFAGRNLFAAVKTDTIATSAVTEK